MPRSQLIKFGASRYAKKERFRAAKRSQTTATAILRDFTYQAAVGRSVNDAVRNDMAMLRQLAHAVLTCVDGINDPSGAEKLADAAQRLGNLVNTHLGAAK